MNENTYAKLEYEKIIDLLVNECSADLTKEKARELKPVTERKIVEMWQEETSEGVLMRRMEPNIPLGGIIDIRNGLRKIEIGGMPEEFEFLQIMDVLRASRRLRVFLSERKKNYETPHLSGWGGRSNIWRKRSIRRSRLRAWCATALPIRFLISGAR